MVQIYRKKWERGIFNSLFAALRDAVVLFLPVKRLPRFLIKILYGSRLQFAFLVHPRMYQDIFIAQPFLNPLKFFFRKKMAYRFLSWMPPTVLNYVHTKQGLDGVVIAQATLPEIMLRQRKRTRKVLESGLKLFSKIATPNAVAGLGGWFPMISRRGAGLEGYAQSLGLTVTNGHCGTLISIYMTIEKISRIVNLEICEMTIAIIGVGKMGSNVARALNNKVNKLILVDISKENLRKIVKQLEQNPSKTKIELVTSDQSNPSLLRNLLKKSHIGVCVTSTFRNLLKIRDIPPGFIAIDDSRPEALPRDPKLERIVLEGGLLKINGCEVDYDYGFGQDDNVFGCLGEAFLLALDGQRILKPTLGEVEMENFFEMLDFARANGVSDGDLKSMDSRISDETLRTAFATRSLMADKMIGKPMKQ